MGNLDKIASGITISLGIAMPFLLYYSHKTTESAKKMYNITRDIKNNFREDIIN